MRVQVTAKNNFSVLLVFLVVLFVLAPFVDQRMFKYLLEITFSLVLLGGAYAVVDQKKYFIITVIIATFDLCLMWYGSVTSNPAMIQWANVGRALFLILIAAGISRKVFGSRTVTSDTICGAICVYLLFGVIFTCLYAAIDYWVPGSFSISNATDQFSFAKNYREFSYFSFVTLTTLGYGDILPVSPEAKGMASLEAVFGPLYLTILIGRLVGMRVSQPAPDVPLDK